MNAIPGCLKSGIVVIFIIFPSKGIKSSKFVPLKGMNLLDFIPLEGKLCDFVSKMSRKACGPRR